MSLQMPTKHKYDEIQCIAFISFPASLLPSPARCLIALPRTRKSPKAISANRILALISCSKWRESSSTSTSKFSGSFQRFLMQCSRRILSRKMRRLFICQGRRALILKSFSKWYTRAFGRGSTVSYLADVVHAFHICTRQAFLLQDLHYIADSKYRQVCVCVCVHARTRACVSDLDTWMIMYRSKTNNRELFQKLCLANYSGRLTSGKGYPARAQCVRPVIRSDLQWSDAIWPRTRAARSRTSGGDRRL